jgi:hypothetical protein
MVEEPCINRGYHHQPRQKDTGAQPNHTSGYVFHRPSVFLGTFCNSGSDLEDGSVRVTLARPGDVPAKRQINNRVAVDLGLDAVM